MSERLINITLGTAGHIDHGKTALIKCLTGCDTDYLKAEKQRGMSIELGFAPCTISGLEVGIVDVPGHENFIKTMVAGASGIDGVIFVIAADDGVMPQTREHLDILTLLGVKHGIVALTKIDTVDAEHIEIVTEEITDFLRGTFLEAAPILGISSITGAGFGPFLEALHALVDSIAPKPADGIFRMPIERTFSLKGYGTVVTGIPVAGTTKIGDELTVFGSGQHGRIKNVQVYKHTSDTAMVGQCAAINVPQWDYKDLRRGDVVTVGDCFRPEQLYLCDLRVLDQDRLFIKNAASMKFHTGTSEVVATVFLLEGNVAHAGQRTLAQIRLSSPVVAGPGDRFILRVPSPAQTVGGGCIVEALGARLKRSKPGVLEEAAARAAAVRGRETFVEYCLKTARRCAASRADLAKRVKLGQSALDAALENLLARSVAVEIGSKLLMHRQTVDKVASTLTSMIAAFHKSHAESPGITPTELLEQSRLDKPVFDGVLALLLSQGKLVERKDRLALPEHKESFSDDQARLLAAVEALFRDSLFSPPKVEEAAQTARIDLKQAEKLVRILLEQQRLVRVETMYFHADAIERGKQILADHFAAEDRLESVKFKYLLDTTRKFAIPLLDHFDRIGFLKRVGNTRYLNK